MLYARRVPLTWLAAGSVLLGLACSGSVSVNTNNGNETGGSPGATGGDAAAPSGTGGRAAGSGGSMAQTGGGSGGRTAQSGGGSGGTMMQISGGSGGSVNTSWDRRNFARVLLSGHSLIDNPVARPYLESMAQSRGHDYNWERQIIIGSPIRVRTRGMDGGASTFTGYAQGGNKDGTNKDLLAELRSPTSIGASERYDTLVIAERNDFLGTLAYEGTIQFLRHYHDRLREQNDDARTFLYQTWPQIDPADPEEWLAYVEKELILWECAAAKVNLTLERDGFPKAVSVLPTGVALVRFLRAALDGQLPGISGSPTERVHAVLTDDVHLSPAGAYLMAASIYAAVFGQSPVGLPAPGDPNPVSAELASAAAEIAWEVVSSYQGRSDKPWDRTMEECNQALTDVCPDFWSIHNSNIDCAHWGDARQAFQWPDTSIPLPPP